MERLNNRKLYFIVWTLILSLSIEFMSSCQDSKEDFYLDTSQILKPSITIKRYGKALLNTSPEELRKKLPDLQKDFPLFLNGDLDDTLNIIQLTNFIKTEYIQEAKERCETTFKDLTFLEEGVATLFQRNKAIFKDFQYPEVYTYISGFDIERRTDYFEDAILVSLDMYLGEDFVSYQKLDFPSYKQHFFEKEYILRDLSEELNLYRIPSGSTFLEKAIAEGKKLLLLDILLPQTPDSIKIKYKQEQLLWINTNERELWSFLIENELLYTKDAKVIQKFFIDSPFTSYFGQESPPRLGQWLGWQIVKKYFEDFPKTDITKFIKETNAQLILKRSTYRPE